jgi:predicted nucleotidyltransferase component of viral defense system
MHKKPEAHKVKNFYGMNFKIHTLNIDELVAEKLRSMLMRNQPRDYFDMYFILKRYKLDMSLANQKLQEAGSSFNVDTLFNNANKIFSRWESDLMPITNRKIKYLTVIRYLQRYFKYKAK